MAVNIPEDPNVGRHAGSDLCATCARPSRCKSIPWRSRPCEQLPASAAISTATPTPPDARHVFSSGAKSSGQLPRYDLIPWHLFAERLARRYTEGAQKYGEVNWQQGLHDRAYVLDRANHTLVHLHRAIEYMRDRSRPETFQDSAEPPFASEPRVTGDDDLAAALWGVIFLMAAQRGSADL